MFVFAGQLVPTKVGYRKMMLYLMPVLLVNGSKYLFGSASAIGQIDTLVFSLLILFVYPLILLSGPRWKRITHTAIFHVTQLLADATAFAIFIPAYGTSVSEWSVTQTGIYFLVTWSVYIAISSICVFLGRSITARSSDLLFALSLSASQSDRPFVLRDTSDAEHILAVRRFLGTAVELALLSYTIVQEQRGALEAELQEIRHAKELEHLRYQALKKQREDLARIRHDFNNQLAVIVQLIRDGERESAEQMICSLEAEINASQDDLEKEGPYA